MRRQLLPALLVTAAMTVLLGLVYPAVVWGIGQVAFRDEAEGSLVERDGVVVGSALLGQSFTDPGAFHPRPSAAGTGYDGMASSGSNVGPNDVDALEGTPDDPATADDEAVDGVTQRVRAYREENGLSDDVPVPSDAVTASASGLDPHISVANARLQARRVAAARNLPLDRVLQLLAEATERRPLGVLGDEGVNVLRLNLALDAEGR